MSIEHHEIDIYGFGGFNPYLNWDETDGDLILTFVEPTHSHRERLGDRAHKLNDLGAVRSLVAVELLAELSNKWHGYNAGFARDIIADWAEGGDDVLEFEFFLGNYSQLSVEGAVDIAWPYVGALANIFEPGTFGSRYAFGAFEN